MPYSMSWLRYAWNDELCPVPSGSPKQRGTLTYDLYGKNLNIEFHFTQIGYTQINF